MKNLNLNMKVQTANANTLSTLRSTEKSLFLNISELAVQVFELREEDPVKLAKNLVEFFQASASASPLTETLVTTLNRKTM